MRLVVAVFLNESNTFSPSAVWTAQEGGDAEQALAAIHEQSCSRRAL
jgi:hypothetical protein